jgi:hypothetical protein
MSSGGRKPPDAPVLFLDRDIWSIKLGDALIEAGIPFLAHHQRFSPDARDEDWLAEAGRQAWIVLTRDQHIRRKPNELEAFKRANVVLFVLSQGNLSATETAKIVIGAYERIVRAAKGARRPAMFTLTREGRLSPLKFR